MPRAKPLFQEQIGALVDEGALNFSAETQAQLRSVRDDPGFVAELHQAAKLIRHLVTLERDEGSRQPTPGEVRATIGELDRRARALLDGLRASPAIVWGILQVNARPVELDDLVASLEELVERKLVFRSEGLNSGGALSVGEVAAQLVAATFRKHGIPFKNHDESGAVKCVAAILERTQPRDVSTIRGYVARAMDH